MRIEAKLNLAILAVLTMCVGANLVVLQWVIRPTLDGIDTQLARAAHARVLDALHAAKSKIRGVSEDAAISAGHIDVQALRAATATEFEILPPERDGEMPTADVTVTPAYGGIDTSSAILGENGTAIAVLVVTTPRTAGHAAGAAILAAIWHNVLAGVLAVIALSVFCRAMIVTRLKKLVAHLETVAESGELKLLPDDSLPDEIGALASSFNNMALQVNHLRDAQAESCYLMGMSQWAASTLHNLRNGLSPIAAVTWQLDKLFDESWLKRLSEAVTMHAAPGTSPDQRSKLNTYIVGNMTRMVEAGLKTRELKGRIDKSHASIVGLVSGFETYARQTGAAEQVDLIGVLRDAAEAVAGFDSQPVVFDLPDEPIAVYTSRIMLRQFMVNLFAFARNEAAEDRGRRLISVRLKPGSAPGNNVKLLVNYSGHGYTPKEIQAAFELKPRQKIGKDAGLGLHWCANTIHQIGGSIQLTSSGPGTGATITLTIPQNCTLEMEAA